MKIIKLFLMTFTICLLSVILCACANNSELIEYFAIVNDSIDKAVAKESGEVLVSETIKAQTDIEGVLEAGHKETYIQFIDGTNGDFTYTTDFLSSQTGEYTSYVLLKADGVTYELHDGEGEAVSDAEIPDFFESLRIGYEQEDIKSATAEIAGGGIKCYTFTMQDTFADTFDSTAGDSIIDCTAITYTYNIDNTKTLSETTVKYTYKVTTNGVSQSAEKVISSKIA